MSENKLFLELITLDKTLISEEVDEVYLPGSEGDLDILPMHAELISSLRYGEMRYRSGRQVDYVAIDGGFLKVDSNRVTVLADGAELGRDINLEEAMRRKQKAEKDLEDARTRDEAEFRVIEAKLIKEIVRIGVAGRYR